MRITFVLSICCLLSALAQGGVQQPLTPQAAVKFGFEEVSGWLVTSADLVPADKYTYKPVTTVRSFGELIAHTADGMNWYCGSALKSDVQWSDAAAKGNTSKATAVAALKKAVAGCNAAYGSSSARIEKLMANIAHSNLHYGNVVTYMRMLGLKPPSS